MSQQDEAGSLEAGAELASSVLRHPSDGETGGQSNRQGRRRLYLRADCFGFMWTPSNAPILSQPTLRSLSPYNLWQSTSLPSLPVLLFGWTAEAKSRGELVLPLKMTPVPLHFLPRHCVLHGLYRGNRCVAFDLASYSTWIWWWLFHERNTNSTNVLQSALRQSQTACSQHKVKPQMEGRRTKTFHPIISLATRISWLG